MWQTAATLHDRIDTLLDLAPARLRASFRDRLERAALSVSNNIAAGCERGSTAELLAALDLARGSAGEVRSMLIVAGRRPYLANLKSEISDLIAIAESCSRQIRAWAASLQKWEFDGPRLLNVRSRADYERHPDRTADPAAFHTLLRGQLLPDPPLDPEQSQI